METITVQCAEKFKMFVRVWKAEYPVAILHLLHGMNGHSLRFSAMAEYLSFHGVTVYAADSRGHGLSATDETRGHIADKNGWRFLLDDHHVLAEKIAQEHPKLPIFLFGHSMGAFIARNLITEIGDKYQGVILSGVAHYPLVELQGYLTALIPAIKLLGAQYRSDFVHKIGLKGMNRKEQQATSGYDWLSADRSVGQTFAEDSLNPRSNSLQYVIDLLKLIERMQDVELVRKIPKELPMIIYSGDKDPIGKYGASLPKVEKFYKKAGLHSVKGVLLRDMRHEPHSELAKDQWFYELLQWIKQIVVQEDVAT